MSSIGEYGRVRYMTCWRLDRILWGSVEVGGCGDMVARESNGVRRLGRVHGRSLSSLRGKDVSEYTRSS